MILVMVLICLLPSVALKAQDTLTVSLSKAIEIGLSESPTIKVANKEIQRVDYSKKEGLAALFPTISGSGTYSRNFAKSKMVIVMNGTPVVMEFGTDNSISAGLSASLPIIAPTLWASLKMNEIDAQLVLESARSSKLSLINQISKAYYQILLAQDSYDVFVKSYQSSADNAKIISDKYKQGTVSEYEWIRADVQSRNSQSGVVSARSAVNMSKLQLKLLMGMDMYTELKVSGKLSDFESYLLGGMANLDTTAIHQNTDLKQFDIRMKQMDQTLKMQKSAWLPILASSLSYSYNTLGNDNQATADYVKYPASSLGLALSIPIFQGGTKYFKYKQLLIQQEELKDQRENLKKSLDFQAITYIDNMNKAIEKIESNKKALEQAEKALTISQKRYEVGAGTYLDITNSDVAYVQAGLSYNQSIYDYLSAKSDLEKLLGKESSKN
jgi:outer membrane protein TolC